MRNNKNKKQTSMEVYLKGHDFKLLKSQKHTLINLQTKIEKARKGERTRFTEKDWDAIEGMINFCDSIQDIAVDEYGYPERTVFRRTRGDK